VSDRITVLNFGKKCRGAPQEVLRIPEMIAAYLGVGLPMALLELKKNCQFYARAALKGVSPESRTG